jgi:hypothetical protein
MVGALRGIVTYNPRTMAALAMGISIGGVVELARKLIKNLPGFKRLVANSRAGRVWLFLLEAVLLPSPYAFAFGGFVELSWIQWWAIGGVTSSLFEVFERRFLRAKASRAGELPPDMSTTSLVGGGLIAGDALAALAAGIYGLWQSLS